MENQKYMIGAVQQTKLLELGLDIKDAYILTYLKVFFDSNDKILTKTINGEVYYWIKYENIIKYLPTLKIDNLKVISRRLRKFEELGLIKRHVHRPFDEVHGTFKGAYTFIHLTKEFTSLFNFSDLQDDEDFEKLAKELNLS